MEQTLTVELSIPIPSDSILIKKTELEELKKQTLEGQYLTIDDVAKKVNKNKKWIVEKILNEPKFKRKLDAKNGGFVHYPKSKGDSWVFLATQTIEFLETNFSKIFK